ncbi:MAG: acylphosphatase [Planctomycetota bacterium]
MQRCAFAVRGRVQGVGFRWFTERAAGRHGVAGWVRNEPDGSVCGEVEGPPAAVAAFLAELRRGPRAGRVDELTAADLPVRGEAGFTIR